MTRDEARARDAADPLRPLRDRFHLPKSTIYLDGNSLGALPRATAGRVAQAVTGEWGRDLIGSWNTHGWIGLPTRLAVGIAPLIGAAPDEVIVADSTSVNLFKLLVAGCTARGERTSILTEPGNFPTDLYVADGVARLLPGRRVRTVPANDIAAAIDGDTAVVLLTHVHYKSGAMHDMAVLTAAAHAQGALVLWDLSHSTGAVPVDLSTCDADMAVGCGYKYLNGGPGAPAFLYVARRLQDALRSPLSGWMGHAAPFAFDDSYAPADGMRRFLCGTPPVLAMAALEAGIATFDGVELQALFAKGRALGDAFVALVEAHCEGLTLLSPRDATARGSHVSFAHPDAYALCQALIARGVIGDFRAPDAIRFGFAPLYLGFEDVWRAVDVLRDILASRQFDRPEFRIRGAVT